MPAGWKRDLPLAKTEPIGSSEHDFGVTFEKKKNLHSSTNRGVRICEKDISADTLVSVEEEEGDAPEARRGRNSPAACGADCGEVGCAPAAQGALQWSTYPPAACGGPSTRRL